MERELLFTYKLGLIILGLECHTPALLQIHQAWQVHYTATFYKFWHLIHSLISLSTKNTFIRVHRAAAVETESLAAFIREIFINTICFQLSICLQGCFFLNNMTPCKVNTKFRHIFLIQCIKKGLGVCHLSVSWYFPKSREKCCFKRKKKENFFSEQTPYWKRWNVKKCRLLLTVCLYYRCHFCYSTKFQHSASNFWASSTISTGHSNVHASHKQVHCLAYPLHVRQATVPVNEIAI